MSAAASRKAFEAWWNSPRSETIRRVTNQDGAWHAWCVSRKQALDDAASLCHDAATNDPTLTARFCAHALKALK